MNEQKDLNTNVESTPKKAKRKDENQIRDEYIALQRSLSGRTRRLDIALIAIFMAFIVIFPTVIFLTPDKTFSEQENRYLQTMPAASSDFHGSFLERLVAGKFLDRFFEGKFTEEISDYLADQFPLRDVFVGLKAGCEIALLKQENNSVLLGKDDYIIKRNDFPNADALQKNITAMKAFTASEEAKGVAVYTALAGRSIDVLASKLPALFDAESNQAILGELANAMAGEDYIDLLAPLKEKADAGETVYYRTDHHWTTLGAYYAYCEIAEAMGLTPYPLDSFTVETASDAFYGTTWSSAGMKWVGPEELHFFRFEGDEDYTTAVGDRTFASFYDRSYLDKKDKYSTFLSGNSALVKVNKNGEERETLVIVKDSYAHSIAPFLARHFDLLLVDLRYYNASVSELMEQEGASKLLYLYNVANLCDDTSLSTIR